MLSACSTVSPEALERLSEYWSGGALSLEHAMTVRRRAEKWHNVINALIAVTVRLA
jgi:hypothetical protein